MTASHFLPFGKFRGRNPRDVPDTDYLLWFLKTCKPSTGLRAAVRAELLRRGIRESAKSVLLYHCCFRRRYC